MIPRIGWTERSLETIEPVGQASIGAVEVDHVGDEEPGTPIEQWWEGEAGGMVEPAAVTEALSRIAAGGAAGDSPAIAAMRQLVGRLVELRATVVMGKAEVTIG